MSLGEEDAGKLFGQNEGCHIALVGQHGGALLVEILVAIVDCRHAADLAGRMIEQGFDHMRRRADLRMDGSEGPAQIVERPADDFRGLVEPPLVYAERVGADREGREFHREHGRYRENMLAVVLGESGRKDDGAVDNPFGWNADDLVAAASRQNERSKKCTKQVHVGARVPDLGEFFVGENTRARLRAIRHLRPQQRHGRQHPFLDAPIEHGLEGGEGVISTARREVTNGRLNVAPSDGRKWRGERHAIEQSLGALRRDEAVVAIAMLLNEIGARLGEGEGSGGCVSSKNAMGFPTCLGETHERIFAEGDEFARLSRHHHKGFRAWTDGQTEVAHGAVPVAGLLLCGDGLAHDVGEVLGRQISLN